MRHDIRKSVWDAMEACRAIWEFADGLTLETYLANRRDRRAIERELEILGEALNRIDEADPSFRNYLPEMGRAIGMRNRLAHGYDRVSDTAVWAAAKENIPIMHGKLAAWLEKNGQEQGTAP